MGALSGEGAGQGAGQAKALVAPPKKRAVSVCVSGGHTCVGTCVTVDSCAHLYADCVCKPASVGHELFMHVYAHAYMCVRVFEWNNCVPVCGYACAGVSTCGAQPWLSVH